MIAEFLVTSFLVALIPGTGVVYTVSSAIGGGWRRGLFAAIGCTLGILPHMAAAMLGLSGIMQTGATVFEVVRWAGVAYLVFIGLSMFREGGALRMDNESARNASMAAVVRRGILVNLLNPKLTLFFFAFLPQFVDPNRAGQMLRMLELSGIFMAMTLVIFILYGLLAAAVRDNLLARPRLMVWLRRAFAGSFAALGARLVITDR
jgi:threonine/homoserine/homoserine lactone efflux protein